MQHPFIRHNRHATFEPHARKFQTPAVQLEIVRGRAQARLRPVTVPAFLIGSAHDCDLVLADPHFPQVHAYLRLTRDQVCVRHLGFLPQLSLNGQVVNKAVLSDGDCIRTGPYEFLVHIRPELLPYDEPALRHPPQPPDELREWLDEHPGEPASSGSSHLATRPGGPVLRLHRDHDPRLDDEDGPAGSATE